MKRPSFNLKLPGWHEWLIYVTAGLLLVTGIGWLLLDRFGRVQGEFGLEQSPTLPWLLMLHGIIAYAFVTVVAMLVPVHMRLGWNSGRNRSSGLALVGISIFLVLTGLALYYSASEDFREAADLGHWIVGLAMILVLAIHRIVGTSVAARRRR